MSVIERWPTSLPIISTAKSYTGEIRRDWLDFMAPGTTPERKLQIILKHANRTLRPDEQATALQEIKRLGEQYPNPYSLAQAVSPSNPFLSDLIFETFEWKDRDTERWFLVYAIALVSGTETLYAEVGGTEKSLTAVKVRFERYDIAKHNTWIGSFFTEVRRLAGDVWLLPLECGRGSLNWMDRIKGMWCAAGRANGVKFCRTSTWSETATIASENHAVRTWPEPAFFVENGLPIHPISPQGK